MRHPRSFLILCVLLAIGCGSSKDATGVSTTPVEIAKAVQDPEEARPRFYAECINIISDDTAGRAKLLISLVAVRADLMFTTIKVNDTIRYRAAVTWDVKLSFNDPNKKIEVRGANFVRQEIVVNTYEETRRGVTVTESIFYVTPNASYRLEVIFTDEETGISNKRIYPTIGSRLIKDGDFNIADPIIFAAAAVDSTSLVFVPLNSRRVDPWQKIPFITVIYYPPKGQRILVYYEIRGPKNEIVFQKTQIVPATQKNWSFDTLFVELPNEAGNGNYSLFATATSENSTVPVFTASKNFDVYSIIPRSAKEFDEAAEQMIYIQSAKTTIDSILNTPSVTEKKRFWLAFWDKIDPDPVRARMLMKEYYRRVAYANEHFRSPHQKGWRTDRGRVYIRFDKPDHVDRYLFGGGAKSYEIWHYYRLRARDTFYTRRLGFLDNYKFFIFIEQFIGDYNFGDGDIYCHNIIEFED